MDLHGRDLRYFLAVAEELSFTRAAERLYVSQPALSKQIRALERQLGAPLFTRDPQRVILTPVGEALLPHARTVLAALDAATAAVEQARMAQRSTLVIGMGASPGRGGLLPAVRSRFLAAYPEVTLKLRQVGWQDPTAGLSDGSSDLAYIRLPLPDPERYATTVVSEEPRLIALPPGHHLAGTAALDFADLLNEPFLALPHAAGPLRDYWLAMEKRAGRPVRVGAEVAGIDEVNEALAAGLGVIVTAAGDIPLLDRGGVTFRPVRDLPPLLFALARRANDQRPLVRAYEQALRAVRDIDEK
ncbi:LysR family transcriptional regulator [Nocardia sp. CA-119907]|uniref:LysR family transcriptional regulator n=1 Tax=Nocardia sp. CA-119907 TaxID=3239973 RepID=UPI003D962460